jgi:hypothetical protein
MDGQSVSRRVVPDVPRHPHSNLPHIIQDTYYSGQAHQIKEIKRATTTDDKQ